MNFNFTKYIALTSIENGRTSSTLPPVSLFEFCSSTIIQKKVFFFLNVCDTFFSLCKIYIMCTTWSLLMLHVKDLIAISYFLFLTNYLQCIIGQKVKGTCLLFVRNDSNVIFRPSHYLHWNIFI